MASRRLALLAEIGAIMEGWKRVEKGEKSRRKSNDERWGEETEHERRTRLFKTAMTLWTLGRDLLKRYL